ncbi:MAG: hypothetical protein ACHQCF_07295 [Solirubrobacterales bacterium]
MPRRISLSLTLAALLLAVGALAPLDELPYGAATSAEAAVTKSLSGGGGGGGNVSGAGNRLGTLLSGWAVPVLTVLAGCLLVGALASRNIGTSVGIVVITLLGLIFLLAPQTVESFAKGIASTVF